MESTTRDVPVFKPDTTTPTMQDTTEKTIVKNKKMTMVIISLLMLAAFYFAILGSLVTVPLCVFALIIYGLKSTNPL